MAMVSAALITRRAGFRVPGGSSWLHEPTYETSSVSTVLQRFDALANEWYSESQFMSSVDDMVSLPSYREIIAMGAIAIPLILNELQRRADHWFYALGAITGAEPVPPEHKGRVKLMAVDWIAWGKTQGYIQ